MELVLAVTVLAVGVLAVAASAAPLGRLIRRGEARAAAAAAAGAEIERLRAAGCAAAPSGATVGAGGLRIAWAVAGGDLREITVVATYPWGPGVHSDTFRASVACPR